MVRASLVSLFGVLLLGAAGCQDSGPDIIRQTVPHIAKKVEPREKDRILAALVVDKDKAWSFYMAGPESAVTAHQAKFDDLCKSIKFGDKLPVEWKLPEGWLEEPGKGMRFATLKTDADPKPLDVSVIAMPDAGGDLLANVNRWRNNLSLPPIGKDELVPPEVQKIEIGGRKGARVDLIGKLSGKGMAPMMKQPPAAPPRKKASGEIRYDVPEGWVKVKPKNSVIREQFDITDGGAKAEATIVVLPEGAGGELANMARWRDQIKLPPLDDPKDIIKSMIRIDTASGKAAMIDLDNPKFPGNNRIIGLILPTEGATYFLKLHGPSDLVGRQKPRFEAFAKSFKVD